MSEKKNILWLLVKNRLQAQFGFNVMKYESDKKKKKRRQYVLFAVVAIALVLIMYMSMLSFGLEQVGMGRLIPLYGLVICSAICFFFTAFKANGELFAYKDYDILMSLPIKTSTVIASRFTNLYLWNTAFTAVVMVPMGIIYSMYEKPGVYFVAVYIIGILLAGLIPTTVATIIGAFVTAAASRFRFRSLFTTIISMVIVLGILSVSSGFAGRQLGVTTADGTIDTERFSQLTSAISSALVHAYPPAWLYQKGVVSGNVGCFLLFAAISVAWYVLFVWVLSKYYKKINTAVSAQQSKSDFKMKSLRQNSMLKALYRKEWKRWTSSSVYMTNTIIGALFAIAASIFLYAKGAGPILDSMGLPMLQHAVVAIIPFFSCILLGMCCTTCSSLSLEGKNLWILRCLPIPSAEIYKSKILVNLTISVPCALVSSAIFSLAMRPGAAWVLFYFLIPLAYCFFTAVWGMWINIRIPNFEWENETQVIKQGASTLLGMFPEMLFAIVMLLLALALPLPHLANALILFVVILMAAGLLYRKVIQSSLPV